MFGPKTKILVVDDMMTMRKLVKKTLSELGLTNVIESADAADAWPLVKEAAQKGEPFHLIVSDWNMPKMKGIDFLKALRADSSVRATAFILLTAESERNQIQEAIQAGVDSYIVKPFTVDTVKQRLETVSAKKAG